MDDNEKIKLISEAYLNFATEGTSGQISGFIRRGTFKFKSGKPSPQRVASVLSQSYKFLSRNYNKKHAIFYSCRNI